MKFTDLGHMQQIALVTDIADLNNKLIIMEEPISEELKALNLKRPPSKIRNLESEHIYVNAVDDRCSAASILRFSLNQIPGTVSPLRLSINHRPGTEISPEVSLKRNGISMDFQLTGDLQAALSKISSITEGVETMLGNTHDVSEALSKLVVTFDKAMTLPEHIIKPYYVNGEYSQLLDVTHRMLNRNVSNDYGRDRLFVTEEDVSANGNPIFKMISSHGNTIGVSSKASQFKLLLELGETDPNEVILSYKFGHHPYIDIATYSGKYTEDYSAYLKDLAKWIFTAVPLEYEQPVLTDMAEFLSDTVTNTAPFILKEIVDIKNNPDYMSQPWF